MNHPYFSSDETSPLSKSLYYHFLIDVTQRTHLDLLVLHLYEEVSSSFQISRRIAIDDNTPSSELRLEMESLIADEKSPNCREV